MFLSKSVVYSTSRSNEQEIYYYSFSEIASAPDCLALFRQAEQAELIKCFWQTPDQSLQFLGIGALESYQAVTLEALKQIKANLASRWQQVANPNTNALQGLLQPAILFGGLAFDESMHEKSVWQELANGYFVVPEILLQITPTASLVHYNVRATHLAQAEEKHQQLKAQFEKLVAASSFAQSSNQQLEPALAAPLNWQYVNEASWLELAEKTIAKLCQQNSPLKKVVLARRLQFEAASLQASSWLANLIAQQPNTYRFFLEGKSRIFAGATPERLLKATATHFETASVAGSIRRGTTKKEDQELAEQLLNDPKNTQEHQIVVARIEAQLAAFIEGSLVLGERTILKNQMIQHIYLPLAGKRQQNIDFLSVIAALHPTPALGGEPKELALAWLRQYEGFNRGLYGAPIGWQSILSDEGEFAVGIRSAVVAKEKKSVKGQLFAGCGIVADSKAVEELAETALKFEPMKRSLAIDEPSTSHD